MYAAGILNPVTVVFSSSQAALQELEELKQIVPKESLVYFLIGKVRTDGCRHIHTLRAVSFMR